MWALEITRAANPWHPNYLQQPLLIPKTRRGDVKTSHTELFLLLWIASLGRALNWQINRVSWHGHCACKLVAPITRHDFNCRLFYNSILFFFFKKQLLFSIVKPIRCTIFRVYWISLYMFRAVFPSIIRSPRLSYSVTYMSYRFVDESVWHTPDSTHLHTGNPPGNHFC